MGVNSVVLQSGERNLTDQELYCILLRTQALHSFSASDPLVQEKTTQASGPSETYPTHELLSGPLPLLECSLLRPGIGAASWCLL